MWQIEVTHEGLNKYRVIRGTDEYIVEQKAAMLKISWDEMWKKKQATEERQKERERKMYDREDKKKLAAEKTKEAQNELGEMENILKYTLEVNDAVEWNSLLNSSGYPKEKPTKPKPSPIRQEPKKVELEFSPAINILDFILPFLKVKENKIKGAYDFFTKDHARWIVDKSKLNEKNKKKLEEHKKALEKWEKEEKEYLKEREVRNKRVLEKKEAYLNKNYDAVIDYCEMVLSNSKYPNFFPQQYDLDYNAESKILLVDYFLPSKEDIPTLKEVKFNISQNEFRKIHISDSVFNKLYDNILYQVTLRTIHELYEADVIEAIEAIIFNGFVRFIDKRTGKEETACILSIQAQRKEFLDINLKNVDPKACFKVLKGVGSSKLHGLAPIAPIMKISREDKRFVTPYNVADSVDVTTNIAAMDWQDFENLIRELFEKEFSSAGGEVKITRASRDEGVDAVVFDPDPLRGGKIVIQAKRYTNVVGVAAVRDLYGTVVNEGATKGILVTTTDYGPDAYKFAQDKPLTLLNGSNLLHLLEKHGHKAKIDITEAKKILAEQKETH